MSFVHTKMIAYNSPVGELHIYFNENAITGLYFSGGRHKLPACPVVVAHAETPVIKQAIDELDRYFAGKLCMFMVPIEMEGTPFQKAVWGRLLQVGFGETNTYANIAKEIGKPNAARAVGGAVGKNPISIIVPCHRIVGTNGTLTGFAGGVDAKNYLLVHEQ